MLFGLDIETVPAANKQPYIDAAKLDFKAPSGLTKETAGKDLGLEGDELRYKNKEAVIALWEQRFSEEKAPEVADQAWRKTSLDATYGRIVSVAWKRLGHAGQVICQDPLNERDTLQQFVDSIGAHLSEHGGARQPFFIGHNIVFDLKFLFRRCVILGVRPLFDLPFKGRHDKDYFCTMQAWCEYGERIYLVNLCAALGLETDNTMDGSMVCDYWQAGRYSEICTYNVDDVDLALKAHSLLTFS